MHTATASLTQKNRPINDLSKLPEHKNSDTPPAPGPAHGAGLLQDDRESIPKSYSHS